MNDELNKSQDIHPIAFVDIPTPEEHRLEVRRIFVVCGSFAAGFLAIAAAAIALAIRAAVPLPVIAAASVMGSFLCLVTFGVSYAIPVGLVSLRRLEIAYRMGYFGLSMNREAAGSMKKIAERVSRETAPLPANKRPVVESTAP